MYFQLKDALARAVSLGVSERVRDALHRVPTQLNEFGFDPWGFNPDLAKYAYSVGDFFYRRYWRVKCSGADHIPGDGRVLLIANHSGQLPVDGLMVAVAALVERDPPRLVRGMAERWFPTVPFAAPLMQRMGHVLGDRENCERLLERGEAIMVFPEGVRGTGKTYWHRYELQEFGLGFMRLALKTRTPIVPIGIVGGEEQMPSFANAKPIARLLGMPYVPITPFFPWFGPLGLIPLPTRYYLTFDEPILFEGDPEEPDEEVRRKVAVVEAKINRLIQYGLETRTSIF